MTDIKSAPPAGAKVCPMPWTDERFPVSMRHLEPRIRSKAIEIANALLEQGYEEGKAIRIGIAKAKEWAKHHAPPPRPAHR